MIDYYLKLSSEESTNLLLALKTAMRLAKDVGSDEDRSQILKQYELIGNREMSGGFETVEERMKEQRNADAKYYATWGCE